MRFGLIVSEKTKYKISKITSDFLKNKKLLDEYVICTINEINTKKNNASGLLVTKHRILQKNCKLPSKIFNLVNFKKSSSKKKLREVNGNENIEVYNYENKIDNAQIYEILKTVGLESYMLANEKAKGNAKIFNLFLEKNVKSIILSAENKEEHKKILNINTKVLEEIKKYHPLFVFSTTEYTIEDDGSTYLLKVNGIERNVLSKKNFIKILEAITTIKKEK